MELKGKLKEKISDRSGVSQAGNGWRRASYLLETEEMFPKKVCFEVPDGLTARIAHFDTFLGKDVIVMFDIDAHEFQGRWYNEIKAWGIKLAHPEAHPEQEQKEEKKEDTAAAKGPAPTDAEDGSVDWEGMKP
jgi:hypothetical protein